MAIDNDGAVTARVPAAETRRSVMAKIGMLAAGFGLASAASPGPAEAATTVSCDLVLDPPPGAQPLAILPSGAVPASVSTGGALNLNNSASTGAGAVFYSDRGADATGRLLVVNQSNPANPQHAVRLQNAGIGTTLSIFHNPAGGAGDASAEAVDIVSTNRLDSTLGIRGREQGRGTVKITHENTGDPGSDANASAVSISLVGAGTAAQGLFIGNDADEATTGNLINVRNGGPGTVRMVLGPDGRLTLAAAVEAPGLTLQAPDGEARIYISGERLVVAWDRDGDVLYTSIPLNTVGPYPAPVAVTTDTSPP
jgi:hypothetical protein